MGVSWLARQGGGWARTKFDGEEGTTSLKKGRASSVANIPVYKYLRSCPHLRHPCTRGSGFAGREERGGWRGAGGKAGAFRAQSLLCL